MVNQKINQLEEAMYINYFLDLIHPTFQLKEHPIKCVKQNELSLGQSIPDAIILDPKTNNQFFVEVTTFSRNQDMRKKIGEHRKFPKRENELFNSGTVGFYPLEIGFYTATQKKLIKDYSEFAKKTNTQNNGILLVTFVNDDHFFDNLEHNNFLNKITDIKVLDSWNISSGCFSQIFFGGYITNIGFKFSNIANPKIIHNSKIIRERKAKYLKSNQL